MLSSSTAQATGLNEGRINTDDGSNTTTRNAEKRILTRLGEATMKAAAPASKLDSRLKKAARLAFGVLGGED